MNSERDEILKHLTTQTGLMAQILQTLQRIEAQQGASSAYQWTPEGLPICPRHNEVMPRREKQGDIWYSHKVVDPDTGEVHFCKGYGSSSSPGWSIDSPDDDPDGQPPPPAPPAQIQPMDVQRTAKPADYRAGESRRRRAGEIKQPDQMATPPKMASAAPIAEKVEGDPRLTFYEIGGKAVSAGKITWDKFNSIVNKAARDGWEAGIAELRMVGA